MNTMEAISQRRSIRKYKDAPVPEDILQKILSAGRQAPSGKNRQPWKFIVVKQSRRTELIRILREGIRKSRERFDDIGSCERSISIMGEAPINIIVINPKGIPPWKNHTMEEMFDDVVDIQSVGASIQNMLLAATENNLGSLWICDVFYAYEELMNWLEEPGELIAAISLGYPDENPDARPRKPMEEIVRVVE